MPDKTFHEAFDEATDEVTVSANSPCRRLLVSGSAFALGLLLAGGCATTAATAPPPVGATAATAGEGVPAPAASAASPAGSLAGLRLEVPCKGQKFGEDDTECNWDPALKQTADPKWKLKKEITRIFAGDPAVVYDVTLRVRGVVEPKNFTGGTVLHDHFQIGGTPHVDNYNFYTVKISNPAETYTVNRHQKKIGHYVFAIDYTVTIPIRGGATVTMGGYDDNEIAIANHKGVVVPEVPPAPAPFDGHFFQLDVISAVPKP